METPIIPVACFVLVAWGFVLLMQGALRRDPNTGFSEAQQQISDSYDGMRHPPERHPWRLMAIGAAMVVGGIGLVVLWGAIWG
jgi:hypothetical protein